MCYEFANPPVLVEEAISLFIRQVEITSSSAVQRIPRKYGILGQTAKWEL